METPILLEAYSSHIANVHTDLSMAPQGRPARTDLAVAGTPMGPGEFTELTVKIVASFNGISPKKRYVK
jgi:hypothetical protein